MKFPAPEISVTLLAAGTGLTAYVLTDLVAARGARAVPPRPPAVARPPAKGGRGIVQYLAGLCRGSGLPVTPGWVVAAGGVCAALAVRTLLPLQNLPLMAVTAILAALAPAEALRVRGRTRRADVRRLVGPALGQLARLVRVRRHPYLALVDLAPGLPQPLRAAIEEALAMYRGGSPLPDALQQAAQALGDDPYLAQTAELVRLSLTQGSDLASSLDRLVDRYRVVQELQSEERSQAAGYRLLAWVLFLGSQLPLLWYLVAGGPERSYIIHNPLLRLFVLWNVVSGLSVALLPQFLSTEAV